MGGSARVHTNPSYQRRVCRFDAIGGGKYHPGVTNVYAPVMIQVVHVAISVVIYVDVGGISIHMAAQ